MVRIASKSDLEWKKNEKKILVSKWFEPSDLRLGVLNSNHYTTEALLYSGFPKLLLLMSVEKKLNKKGRPLIKEAKLEWWDKKNKPKKKFQVPPQTVRDLEFFGGF